MNNNHGSCLIIIRYNLLISFLFCLSVNYINSHTLSREKKYGTISFLTHIHQISKHAACSPTDGKRLKRLHSDTSPSCRVITIVSFLESRAALVCVYVHRELGKQNGTNGSWLIHQVKEQGTEKKVTQPTIVLALVSNIKMETKKMRGRLLA